MSRAVQVRDRHEFERAVDSYLEAGYTLRETSETTAQLKEVDYGNALVHALLFVFVGWWTFLISNAVYAAIRYGNADAVTIHLPTSPAPEDETTESTERGSTHDAHTPDAPTPDALTSDAHTPDAAHDRPPASTSGLHEPHQSGTSAAPGRSLEPHAGESVSDPPSADSLADEQPAQEPERKRTDRRRRHSETPRKPAHSVEDGERRELSRRHRRRDSPRRKKPNIRRGMRVPPPESPRDIDGSSGDRQGISAPTSRTSTHHEGGQPSADAGQVQSSDRVESQEKPREQEAHPDEHGQTFGPSSDESTESETTNGLIDEAEPHQSHPETDDSDQESNRKPVDERVASRRQGEAEDFEEVSESDRTGDGPSTRESSSSDASVDEREHPRSDGDDSGCG